MQTSLWNSSSIQTLFGQTNGIFGSLGDYSLIKNGGYGKLMKSYYNQMKSDSAAATSKATSSQDVLDNILNERKQNNVSKDVQKSNDALKKGMSSLSSSLATLQNSSTYETTKDGKSAQDKTVNAIKDYVENYNKVVTSSKGSTLSNITNNVASIMDNTSSNATKLKNIGVNVNSDGTLSIDEKKLKEADTSKIQELFASDKYSSYGSKVNNLMNRSGYYNKSTTIKENTLQQDTKTSANNLKADAKALASKDSYKKKDEKGNTTDEYDLEKTFSNVQSFIKDYNDTIGYAKENKNSGVVSNLSYLQGKTQNASNGLENIGISVNSDGTLKLNEDKFKNANAEDVENTLKDYASSITTNASLIGFYASSQTNGYSANGTYNDLGNPNSIYTATV